MDETVKVDQNQPKRLDSSGNLTNYILVSEQEPKKEVKETFEYANTGIQ